MIKYTAKLFFVVTGLLILQPAQAATYSVSSETYSWIDPSADTNVVWTGVSGGPSPQCTGPSYPVDDDISEALPLGFTFTLGTTNYTSVRIMSNGRIQFSSTYCGYGTASTGPPRIYPYPMPDTRLTGTLRVYGSDLDPSQGGTVRYASSGTSPNRRFVVTWSNVREWNASSSRFSLQVIIYESGDFVYQFGTITNPTQGHAQTGWEVSTSDYELYTYNNATDLQNTALRFSAATPTPTAYYAMDEVVWTGTANEVVDGSGNANHADRIGSAQIIDPGYICNGGQFSGSSDAVNTKLDVNTALGNRGSMTFWFKSDNKWNSGNNMLTDASNDLGSNGVDKYFFLVKRSNGRLRFRLEDSSDTDLQAETSNNSYAAGSWHHVAITWDVTEDADWLQIYIDGTRRATNRGNRTAPLTISNVLGNLNTLYLGDNRTGGVSGNGYTGNSTNGTLDETRIYTVVLSDTQVADDMNATHACLLAQWNMDEPVWDGTADEVVDSSGNAYHGTATNGSVTASASPAITGSPGTCGYGTFDGNNDYVALPSFPNLTGNFTITAWINAKEIGNDQRIFVDDQSNSGGYAFSLGDAGNGRLRFFSRNINPISLDSAAVITADTWYHVTIVHDVAAKTRQIFVNGVAVTSAQIYSGTWGTDSGTASIGGETNAAGSEAIPNWRFNGSIDEVRVYNRAMNAAEITSVMNDVRTCPATFDHVELKHDGSALTCEPETVTVRTCANTNCSALYTGQVTVTLTPTGWVGGDTQVVVSGSSNFQLQHTTAGTVTLGISSASVPRANPVACLNTSDSSTSCNLTFYDTGFIYNVPNLTSCNTSAPVTVSAVRKDNTSQTCVPSFQNRTETINFWSTYSNPTTGSNQLTLNNGATNYTVATSSPGTGVPLSFDNSGQASITVTYPDAGQVALNSSFTGTGSESGLIMSGSDSFISVPAKMYVYSNTANSGCAGNDVNCSILARAGNTFNLKIRAACSDDTVTPNFILNNIPLTHTNTAPGINNGTLGVVKFNMADADNGEHSINNQTVSEVGVFTFTATPPSYLGLAVPAGTSTYIGRFTPDHFCVSAPSLTNRTDSATQAGCSDGFNYLAEDFTTQFTLTAQASSAICGDGSSTRNYTSTFSRFATSNLLSSDNTSNATETRVMNFAAIDTTSSSVLNSRINFNTGSSTSNGTFTNGTLTVIAKLDIARSGSGPSYTAETPLATANIGVNPIDADGVPLGSTNLSINGNAYYAVGATSLYFGRLYADNTFGSENEGLPMWAWPQYCNAQASGICTDWQIKTDDTCTIYTATAPTDTAVGENSAGDGKGYWNTGIDYSQTTGNVFVTDINNHKAGWRIWYTGGGTGGTYTIPFTSHNYLITHDGSASFGLYRGDDRIIYWREVFE